MNPARTPVAIVFGALGGAVGLIVATIAQIQSPGFWIITGACALSAFLGSFFAKDKK